MRTYFALLLFAPLVFAHQQPVTLIQLRTAPDRAIMKLHVPLPELDLAFGHGVAARPLSTWEQPFRQYLLDHIHPVTTDHRPWTVQVLDLTLSQAEQTQSGPFREVVAQLSLAPPPDASSRDFILHYDVILHQVVTHKALVSLEQDWASGRVDAAEPLGFIAVNTATTRIDPLPVRLRQGGLWPAFQGMVRLGAQHIREGTDHLLFLLVLLLPAAPRRIVRIVTAFTLGHSVTLLAGSMNWLALPQQPVEILIAFSILITAIHAVYPLFPGREEYVAAGFGLIHGLAFATVLSDLNLSGVPMATSILGFNTGIELMQLFVIAMVMPWLVLLRVTPAYSPVRIGGAALAGLASLGWILNRVTGETNIIEQCMASLTARAPLGILVLAALAIPAYLYTTVWGTKEQ